MDTIMENSASHFIMDRKDGLSKDTNAKTVAVDQNEKNKRDEMLDDAAWYLMARNDKGEICGYSHFRYDMDFDDEVLYVYEVCSKDN